MPFAILSNLICSGQISKEQALEELKRVCEKNKEKKVREMISTYHPDELGVIFLNAGQGDATIVRFPNGAVMVVDCNIDYSPETSAAFSIGDPDTTLYTDYSIELPVKLVEIWQDTTGDDQNHGILVDFTSAGFIREFSSREGFFSTRVPRMVFVYHEAGKDSTISDTLVATLDASLIDYTGNFDEDKIYISSGYTTRAFFEFDFDSIPKNANISSVNFFYDKDSLNSIINDNRSHNIYMRNVTTDFSTLPGYEIDSTFLYSVRHNILLSEEFSSGLSLDDNLRADAGQYFVQDFINDFVQHGSFFLQYINEGADISVYAIKGVDYPDKAMRPRLIIEYFLNPDGRL